jgi:Flp pilus assembly protein TadG
MSINPALPARMLACLTKLRSDRQGISAIEFALILPLILVLLAGTFDIGQALMVDRRMDQISGTAADLTSQQSSWTTSKLDAIITGTASIIEPFGTTNLTIVVAAISIDSSNNQTVAWSRAYKTTAWTAGATSPVTISSTVTTSGVQMIVARTTYTLQTPFASFLKPITGSLSYSFTRTTMSRPRNSDTITLTSS